MKRTAILLAAALLVMPAHFAAAINTIATASGDNAKVEMEIRQRLAQWVDALKRNDVAMLDQVLADDFQYLLEDGKTRSKAEELAPSKAGDIKFETISTDDVKVFVYGDTAIATGVGTFKGTFKGRAFESRERFCDIYQKRKGQWKVIASRPVTLR
ncbi:MAG: nuclear transport factor 2 family protein [Pyrinomonadaceae bacterium]